MTELRWISLRPDGEVAACPVTRYRSANASEPDNLTALGTEQLADQLLTTPSGLILSALAALITTCVRSCHSKSCVRRIS